MPRVTIEDLQRIRDGARQAVAARAGLGRARVTVHMGTCGIAAGAREVLTALMAAIEQQHLADILVTTSSCAGLCSHEPMATVEIAGQPPVKYVDLTPERMARVLADHVLGGRIVTEYALASGSETTG
jgi:NADP-reducing hydrogenase subunit HndB